MAVVLPHAQLTEADKAYIRKELTINSTSDPPVTIKPYKVTFTANGEKLVWLPIAFYHELRNHHQHTDWCEYPNDLLHPQRFQNEFKFIGQLRPNQEEVWAETFPILKYRRTVLISAHTGFGKTIVSGYISAKAQLVTLVLYHVAPLGVSWVKTFTENTTATVCHIGHDRFNPEAQVYIATVGSVLSDHFPLDLRRVGVLISDETHRMISPQRVFSLLAVQPKYAIFLTATPNRGDGLGKIIGLFSGRLPSPVPVAVERISQRPFTVYKCQTTLRPRIKTNSQGGLDWQEVKNSLIEKPELIQLICDWVSLNPDRKIFIPCIQISQAKAILTELERRGEAVTSFYGTANRYKDNRVLVATIQKTGIGFDIANTAEDWDGRQLDLLILPWTIKDKGATEQVAGRMRGAGGIIVDIVHNFAVFEKHFQQRQEWYLSRNGTILTCNQPRLL